MPELKKADVFKLEVLTVVEFCEGYGSGVTPAAIYNAIRAGLVDYIPIGGQKLIVVTDHTRQYVPNKHPKRTEQTTQNTKQQ